MKSNPRRLLVFDIHGDYGHFRKFNTTSSPLTYAIPTRIAIAGMLGAILGIERELSPGKFPEGVQPTQEVFANNHCGIGIQLLNPIMKTVIGFNRLMTKKSFFEISSRTQVPYELLKYPKFRIFVHLENQALFVELTNRLKESSHHFTPYLGLSQFTGTFDYVDVVDAYPKSGTGDYVAIDSVVSFKYLKGEQPVKLNKEGHYITETMPVSMTADRIVTEYAEVLIEAKGEILEVKTDTWLSVGANGNILFL